MMQLQTIIEEYLKKTTKVHAIFGNPEKPEFMTGYVEQVIIDSVEGEVRLKMCPSVYFMSSFGHISVEKEQVREICISKDQVDLGSGRVTTNLEEHEAVANSLMEPILQNPPDSHLPSRNTNRQQNYPRYLEKARAL